MELTNRAIKGTFIVASSTYLIDLISFLRSIVLARLLVPEYFGIVALAYFFYNIIRQLKEFNLDSALIYKPDVSKEDFSTHFVLKLLLALFTLLVIAIASPVLTRFYGPDVTKIILIFAFFSIFQEAAATPRVVLEKELLFSRVAIINIVKEIIKTIVPIWMVFLGFGLWSLVAMAVLDMAVPFFGFLVTKTWKLSLRFNKKIAIWFLKYSSYMWISGLCITLMYEFDDFLVGVIVGMAALGLYSKAYDFSKLPTQLVTHIVNRVSLPLYSKLKDNKQELSVAFNSFLYFIFRLTLPLALVLFIVAPEFIYFFLGVKWSGAILLLRLLIIYSVLRSIQDDCSALFYGVGRPKIMTAITSLQAIMIVVLGPFFIYFYRVNGAAIFVDLMTIIGIILIYKNVSDLVYVEYRKNFLVPSISALLGLLAVFVLMKNCYISALLVRLIIKLFLFIVVYTGALILFSRDELSQNFKHVFEILKPELLRRR
ncbi:MAG: oligosaccharide flippase family protein [Candidatus Omnitrophica bacterium]|nr:oligosaccharide flippase family protein [Candidatus Omnitrophota bacterium]HOX54455.1 oligosaccharide flippase family protein [Candidatus Omnitrophota bacterium]